MVQHVIKELARRLVVVCKLSKVDGFVKHVLYFRYPKSSGNCESTGVRCGKVAFVYVAGFKKELEIRR